MKLSHIHEDRTPSLADILNEKKIRPYGIGGWRRAYLELGTLDAQGENASWPLNPDPVTQLRAGVEPGIRPVARRWNVGPIKIIWCEQMEYELASESGNPLDNIEDEFGGGYPEIVAVVEGAGQFEEQFAWHNENLDRLGRRHLGDVIWRPGLFDDNEFADLQRTEHLYADAGDPQHARGLTPREFYNHSFRKRHLSNLVGSSEMLRWVEGKPPKIPWRYKHK